MTTPGSHSGKVAIITGAAGEIGAALARGVVEAGARVALCDHRMDAAQLVARQMKDEGFDCAAFELDVASRAAWEGTVAKVCDRFGGLDILVNCAGLFARQAGGIEDLDEAEWTDLFAVNLHGSFYGIQAVLPAMRKRGGAIVNVGSVVGFFGARSGAAYGTSKAAIRGLTVQAAAALIAQGLDIRVNVLHPGYILTRSALGDRIKRLGSQEAAEADFAKRSPRGRCVRPVALVGPLLFLTSDASRYMNGAELLVDDGLSTQMPGTAFDI